MTFLRALAFHAEKLHDDKVWSRVERIARWTARKSIRTTFFVYPFRAQVVGKDITDRVQTLAALGHEIAQHTHFYAGKKIDKPEKIDDLSENNIAQCLSRDYETLCQMGFSPKGFTAGAWFVNPTVLDRLVELGFSYDCSAQYPKPRPSGPPDNSSLRFPRFHSGAGGEILCLPTTCSLGDWFKWGRHFATEGKIPYQLVYLHDYDLMMFRNLVALSCFLIVLTRHSFVPLSTIAQGYSFAKETNDVVRSCAQV